MTERVRQPIDEVALARYLSTAVPSIPRPLTITQFGFGQSNPTYLLTHTPASSSGRPCRYVLRKKPPGALISKTAHKVEREYRVLSALSSLPLRPVPVPTTYCLCEDVSVIGTPFYIMEFLDGRIFEEFLMPSVLEPDVRSAMWKDAVRVMASLHAVDLRTANLETFGKPDGFYKRQVATWSQICAAQARVVDVETGETVGELPHMKELMAYFADPKNQPRDRAGLVHGDFKIDNLVYSHGGPNIIGVLDWEMSTIGHPLSDLCNFLTKFALAGLPDVLTSVGLKLEDIRLLTNNNFAATPDPGFLPGATPGLPTIEDIVQWYAGLSGYDPRIGNELAYGMAFNIFRLAAICHGIAARYAKRQASSAKAKENSEQRYMMAEFAWALVLLAKKDKEKL
ncbi:hypothetical protein TD95_002604 [Thielaviopsis punctulata]|uniref:Aminoglycoside phosphotransferase domain-containing protein n=1 Tax=Thielaviopsis punctulata TaxID=72032 RepID=A0A0F4ZKV1_9PEZI|nr:hypothetical protein TD95_002604 [Thielaviopsis punctulata]